MRSHESDREVEIKLRVHSAETARRLLRGSGFSVVRRRTLEQDAVYDTREGALRKRAQLLRVRNYGSSAFLTYKGPPRRGRHKDREEIETTVSNSQALCRMLERLGMQPSFRYEKYRTEFTKPGGAGTAMLDETPIGVFIELEGPPEWIDSTAEELGFAEGDYITASYAGLYFESRGTRPETPAEMLFGRTEE